MPPHRKLEVVMPDGSLGYTDTVHNRSVHTPIRHHSTGIPLTAYRQGDELINTLLEQGYYRTDREGKVPEFVRDYSHYLITGPYKNPSVDLLCAELIMLGFALHSADENIKAPLKPRKDFLQAEFERDYLFRGMD